MIAMAMNSNQTTAFVFTGREFTIEVEELALPRF